MIELNTIYNEDCMDTMSKMDEDSVDIIVTSPPYNMNLRIRNGKYCSRQLIKEFTTKYSHFNDNLPVDDFYALHREILKEMIRVSKIVFYNISIVTGSKRAFFRMIGDFYEQLKDIIVWDKVNAEPAIRENVLNRQAELILVFESNGISRYFQQAQFARGTLSDVWSIRSQKGKKKCDHNTAVFPEELVIHILNNFASSKDIVYDPFSGTGTVPKVAQDLGLVYIGSEISKDLCEYSRKRLVKETWWDVI